MHQSTKAPSPCRGFLELAMRSSCLLLLGFLLSGWQVGSILVNDKTKEQFRIESKLGEGGFGVVVKARRVGPGPATYVAIKFFKDPDDAADMKSFYKKLFKNLDPNKSDNIIHMDIPERVTVKDEASETYVVIRSELASGDINSLPEFDASSPKSLTAKELDFRLQAIEAFATQGARGLADIAKAGLIHGDIKEANFLVTGSVAELVQNGGKGRSRIVVSDLDGLSRSGESQPYTPGYAAPEFYNANIGAKTALYDFYSFASALYGRFFENTPFDDYYAAHGKQKGAYTTEDSFVENLSMTPEAYADFVKFVGDRLDGYAKENKLSSGGKARLKRLRALILAGIQYQPKDRITMLENLAGDSPLVAGYADLAALFGGTCGRLHNAAAGRLH